MLVGDVKLTQREIKSTEGMRTLERGGTLKKAYEKVMGNNVDITPRHLAGSIIRQLLPCGIPADAFWTAQGITTDFWTPHDIPDASSSFPLASKQTPQWVDFDACVQKMVNCYRPILHFLVRVSLQG